jgi:hypothetical protein
VGYYAGGNGGDQYGWANMNVLALGRLALPPGTSATIDIIINQSTLENLYIFMFGDYNVHNYINYDGDIPRTLVPIIQLVTAPRIMEMGHGYP